MKPETSLLSAQEETQRTRIPNWLIRELHDDVAQDLLFLYLELYSVAAMVPAELTELHSRLRSLERVARESNMRLREVLGLDRSWGSRGVSLSEELEKCVESFETKTGAEVTLALKGLRGQQAPRWLTHHLVAIIAEALRNAWRHGKAQQSRVVVRNERDNLVLTVADDGDGFDASSVEDGHYGLSIMQERAEVIGGRLQVESAPGRGTVVTLYVPRKVLTNQYSLAGVQ
jgi:two-component system nitrate/nitrite sensor histidine kinase NarX